MAAEPHDAGPARGSPRPGSPKIKGRKGAYKFLILLVSPRGFEPVSQPRQALKRQGTGELVTSIT